MKLQKKEKVEIDSLMEDIKEKNLEKIILLEKKLENKFETNNWSQILPTNYKKRIKDVHIQRDKNDQLNNLKMYLLQYLPNLKKIMQTTSKLTNIIGLLVSYVLYVMS